MLDIKYVRENIDEVREFLKARNNDFDLGPLLDLDGKRRELIAKSEELKTQRDRKSVV